MLDDLSLWSVLTFVRSAHLVAGVCALVAWARTTCDHGLPRPGPRDPTYGPPTTTRSRYWLSWNSEHFTRCAGVLYFQNLIEPDYLQAAPDHNAVQGATGFFKQFAVGGFALIARWHARLNELPAWREPIPVANVAAA